MTHKVEMTVTDQDIAHAEHLKKVLPVESKAKAVRNALNITVGLTNIIKPGDKVTVQHQDGTIGIIDIPGVNWD